MTFSDGFAWGLITGELLVFFVLVLAEVYGG